MTRPLLGFVLAPPLGSHAAPIFLLMYLYLDQEIYVTFRSLLATIFGHFFLDNHLLDFLLNPSTLMEVRHRGCYQIMLSPPRERTFSSFVELSLWYLYCVIQAKFVGYSVPSL